jgi:hypothetical protein
VYTDLHGIGDAGKIEYKYMGNGGTEETRAAVLQ